MKKNILIPAISCCFLFLALLPSCKTYMHFKYGVTQPKEETPRSLTSFLEKHHYPLQDQYLFADSGSYCNAMRDPVFSRNLLSNMVFDRNGNLLQKDTTRCQWAGFDVIASLHPDSVYAIIPGLTLDRILRHLVSLGDLTNPGPTAPDFTVIVTWARFMGSYNYRLFDLAGAPIKNPSARIRFVWLNIDIQEDWQLKKSQKVAIK